MQQLVKFIYFQAWQQGLEKKIKLLLQLLKILSIMRKEFKKYKKIFFNFLNKKT
jgi:hypothetical protein